MVFFPVIELLSVPRLCCKITTLHITAVVLVLRAFAHVRTSIVEPRDLELAYFELPLISKWNMVPVLTWNYDNRLQNNVEKRRNCS